jgi:putative transposase
MTAAQRLEALHHRQQHRRPWHAPPHSPDGTNTYLITAACHRHQPFLDNPDRRTEWEARLLAGFQDHARFELRGWVVGPNHYHLLASVDLEKFGTWLGREHNRSSTVWNRRDKAPGRKVWFRFADRRIRGERHYWAALNYIHGNPVKHGWVDRADKWPWSSLVDYLEQFGRTRMRNVWQEYPVGTMGEQWDEQ